MQHRLIANRWQCPDGTILQSKHRHDYVSYVDTQGNYFMVDGGLTCIRTSGNMKDMCVYTDSPFEEQRDGFMWGSRTKNGFKWTKLKDMENTHIEAVLEMSNLSWIEELFVKELEYRKENSNDTTRLD